jgi:hypothetical protein
MYKWPAALDGKTSNTHRTHHEGDALSSLSLSQVSAMAQALYLRKEHIGFTVSKREEERTQALSIDL